MGKKADYYQWSNTIYIIPLSQDILIGLDVAKTSTIALIPLENNLRSLISKFET